MTLDFAMRRRETELVGPARQMPRETKRLSDIEDQVGLRWHVPLVLFYRGRGSAAAADNPAAVIRRTLKEGGAGAVLPTRTSREASFSSGSRSLTPALARVTISTPTTHLT